MVKLNFKLGSKDNSLTPFYLAIEYKRTEIVQRLLKKGADYIILNLYRTPLHLAIFKGYTNAVIKLLEYGADINVQ